MQNDVMWGGGWLLGKKYKRSKNGGKVHTKNVLSPLKTHFFLVINLMNFYASWYEKISTVKGIIFEIHDIYPCICVKAPSSHITGIAIDSMAGRIFVSAFKK